MNELVAEFSIRISMVCVIFTGRTPSADFLILRWHLAHTLASSSSLPEYAAKAVLK
jgi:hypothetical protein